MLSVSTGAGTKQTSLTGSGGTTTTPPPSTSGPSRLPYTAASSWNIAIPSNPLIDSNNSHIVSLLTGSFGSDPTQYTFPVYIVNSSTPMQNVSFSSVWREVLEIGGSTTSGGTHQIPIPAGAKPASGTDANIIVWNPDTGDEWGLWGFNGAAPYTARNGYHYNTNWSGVPVNTKGPRGSGLPYLGGLVRKWEIDQGHIDHAIAFATQNNGPTWVYPANNSDGGVSGGIPEGTRLQLDPSLTDADFTAWGLSTAGKIMARAMQKYGMIVTDKSGHPKAYVESVLTANWGTALSAGTVSHIPLSKFRVIQPY